MKKFLKSCVTCYIIFMIYSLIDNGSQTKEHEEFLQIGYCTDFSVPI